MTAKTSRLLITCAALALPLTACTTEPTDADGATDEAANAAQTIATTALMDSAGAAAGNASIISSANGLELTVDASGISPGPHGIHLHTNGKCDAPDFTSAGGHWNPGAHQHGLENPDGAHAGDLPNLMVGADGTGTMTAPLNSAAAAAGAAGVLDDDGTAVIIHAGPDDMKTDPSGDSGARVACGVLAAPAS